MKLSVVVPVYNTACYLPRCIDSILGQSFSDFELILIDDGSTDHSLEICRKYAENDSRIVVLHQENQGQSSARNHGIDIARGAFITFIDSDDAVDTDMFRYMLTAAQSHNADLVTCEFETIQPDGANSYSSMPEQPDKLVPESELLYNFYHTNERPGYTTGVVWAKLYKRELFGELRFPTGMIYEDTFLIPYLYEKVKLMVATARPFYKYFTRDGSTVNGQFREKHLDALYVMEDQYRFFAQRPKYGQTDLAQFTYARYFIRYYYTVHLLNPDYISAIKPYKRIFVRMLPSIWRNPKICKMEKLCMLLMLLCPKRAVALTRKYFPESLPEVLRQQ